MSDCREEIIKGATLAQEGGYLTFKYLFPYESFIMNKLVSNALLCEGMRHGLPNVSKKKGTCVGTCTLLKERG